MTQREAIQKAKAILQSRIEMGEFPADIWVPINQKWDVNLVLEGGQPKAFLYPTDENGVTDAFGEIEITLPEQSHVSL